MATWPATLPTPLVDGYELSPSDQTIRTDMEIGSARQRRRTVARNDHVSVAWVFDETQMTSFRAWFDDAVAGVAGGAAWFTTQLRIGSGLESREARFIGPWSGQYDGQHWRIAAKLEVR